MSIAGGCHRALEIAADFNCDTVQLFTKNSNQWKGKPLKTEDIELFRETLKRTKLKFPTAHDSYLINLASPSEDLYCKSIEAFVDEVERAESLGLSYLVMHPGAHLESGEAVGIERVVKALDEVHGRCKGFKVKVLLENTAGQGTTLGFRFEHLARILDQLQDSVRVGICFDTCHALAAGYDLSTKEGYISTFQEFDDVVGFKQLKVFHVNDSKKPLGSRVDRHEHLGRGHIGSEAFGLLVNDSRFQKLPMILETPKEDGETEGMDHVNLDFLRKQWRVASDEKR